MRHPNIATESTLDTFDVTLAELIDLPDGLKTKPTTIQVVTPIVGRAEAFIIQTIRHEIGKTKPKKAGESEEPIFGLTTFVQHFAKGKTTRIVFPPQVGNAVAAQRESLAGRARKRGAQKAIQTRLDRGDTLGNPEALKRARKARKGGKK